MMQSACSICDKLVSEVGMLRKYGIGGGGPFSTLRVCGRCRWVYGLVQCNNSQINHTNKRLRVRGQPMVLMKEYGCESLKEWQSKRYVNYFGMIG